MDDIARYNQTRWDELARRGVAFSRPFLHLTVEQARSLLDPHSVMGSVQGKNVLCLAASGGQQSAAFHLMGAQVTVLDLSPAMLERDLEAARHYGASFDIQQGDMRDLSRFTEAQFDLVWHAYSINFIPDPRPVFTEVTRVLRPGGRYRIEFHNPLAVGLDERDWDGRGYPIGTLYQDHLEVQDPPWEFENADGRIEQVTGPRMFLHTLSGVVNPLIGLGFHLLGLWEDLAPEYAGPAQENPLPGSWGHFTRVIPPWLTLWWQFAGEAGRA